MNVTAIAINVPLGILYDGSFKSPDILTPTSIPVTAGKNIEKTIQKPTGASVTLQTIDLVPLRPPKKNERSARPRQPIITNCTLIAQSAPIKEINLASAFSDLKTIIFDNPRFKI